MNLNKLILANFITLYKYLTKYGVDKFKTKSDLLLLLAINDFICEAGYYNSFDEETTNIVNMLVNSILNSNKQLVYSRNKCTISSNIN